MINTVVCADPIELKAGLRNWALVAGSFTRLGGKNMCEAPKSTPAVQGLDAIHADWTASSQMGSEQQEARCRGGSEKCRR